MIRLSFLAIIVIMFMAVQNVVIAQEEIEEILDIVSGNIAAVDLSANKLTITDIDGETQDFDLDPNLTTVWDDVADEEKELGDLQDGKEVVVEFRVDESGKKIASWIDLVASEEIISEPIAEEMPEEETSQEEESGEEVTQSVEE